MDIRGKALDIRRAGMDARLAGAQGPPEVGPDGQPIQAAPIELPELEFEKTALTALDNLGKQNVAIAQAIAQLAAAVAAPKKVVRDPTGVIVGVTTLNPTLQ
jgi:hypothetical protein